ncbi:hypothetical protein [Bradyrhizobium sp. Leo121]|uniref:hypothetical protein n=1 Tax=Bradyrhizobium sp. Leo121 TaxID=1571195 RepID=UPI00102A98D0|nr:hypothetical protein [Bradyrhizobium sp. Leo121]RZN30502.1 hypothetical protein CWO90_20410 [Bradyrhizobium sp. Leo121]
MTTNFDLYLHHGRKSVDEDMNDWGSRGPVLKEVIGIHQTYGSPINVYFANRAAMLAAQQLTGWDIWDDRSLTMRWKDDLVEVISNGEAVFFGDWGLIAAHR